MSLLCSFPELYRARCTPFHPEIPYTRVPSTMYIIGITGAARSDKDTLAEYLAVNHGYRRVAFADSIREVVSLLTGLTIDELTDSPLKEEPIEWMRPGSQSR